jgi:hypothetical protein
MFLFCSNSIIGTGKSQSGALVFTLLWRENRTTIAEGVRARPCVEQISRRTVDRGKASPNHGSLARN